MTQRYSALRLISSVNKVIGWIAIVLGSVAAVVAAINSQIGIGVLILIVSLFVGLILIASGEIIRVIIDIEENTREAVTSERKSRNRDGYDSRRHSPTADDRDRRSEINNREAIKDATGSTNTSDKEARSKSVAKELDVELMRKTMDRIKARGYSVAVVGTIPNIKWTVKRDFELVKVADTLEELIEFSKTF